MKKLIMVFCLLCTVLLSACTNSTYVKPEVLIDEDSVYMQRCTGDTPIPTFKNVDKNGKEGYDGVEMMNTFTKWQLVYDKCAQNHDALIKLIKDLQEAKKVTLTNSKQVK